MCHDATITDEHGRACGLETEKSESARAHTHKQTHKGNSKHAARAHDDNALCAAGAAAACRHIYSIMTQSQ